MLAVFDLGSVTVICKVSEYSDYSYFCGNSRFCNSNNQFFSAVFKLVPSRLNATPFPSFLYSIN